MIKGTTMHKFLLTALLASLSTSAFALFPVQTDWQANHLQGKVKSVISHSEDNPDAVEGEVVTNDVRQFYNEQGFLIKTEEITQESEFSDKTTANYRYDQNNRLEEIRSDIYKETHGRLYHYQENRDGSGVILEITYVGKKPKKPNFQEDYIKRVYDKDGKLISEDVSYAGMLDGHAKKFHYKDDKLIKACDFDDNGKESNCETYRYLENGDFVNNTSFNNGRADFTYDKNHNELKREIFDQHGKLEETLTTRHKFDQHGNVIESIMYDEKGIWLNKTTKKYEYYQ